MMNCSDAAEEKEEKTAYDSLKDCSPDNAASFLAAADECNSFKCTKCHDLVSQGSLWEKYALYGHFSEECKDSHWIWVLHCQRCLLAQGVWVQGKCWSFLSLLETTSEHKHGIFQVEDYRDRLVLFCLSQICYQQDVTESDNMVFLCSNPREFAKVIWFNNHAAGFYTLKPKGSPYTGSNCDAYHLPVVDMIYVRGAFRRQGLATALISDALKSHQGQDIGFSEPVSEAMLAVIAKFLAGNLIWRHHVWEVSWTGGEDFRRNIWLKLRAKKRKLLPT